MNHRCYPFFCLFYSQILAWNQLAIPQEPIPEVLQVQPDSAAPNSPDELVANSSPADEEYYELLKLFADTVDQVERNYVSPISRREIMEAAIQGVLSKLDPYSEYIPPDEIDDFKTGVNSEFGGIGIRFAEVDQRLTVITPLLGAPAYRAGVLAEDWIMEINGQSTLEISQAEAAGLLKGKVGEPIELTVRHQHDGAVEKIKMVRETVKVETVVGIRRQPDGQWDFWANPEKKLGYIRISLFSHQTAASLRQQLQTLVDNGARGLILDLRFNPGGLLSAAIEISDMFLSSGTIVSTQGRNVESRVWTARPETQFPKLPVVVLMNHYSASASEIVAAALQDHDRAVVVGERSWGKGSVQNVIELERGRSALKLTTAGYFRPSGKNIHRAVGASENDQWGVSPSDGFLVETTPNEVAQLLRAYDNRDVLQSNPQEASKLDKTNEEIVDRQLQTALQYLADTLVTRAISSNPQGNDE